MIRRLIILLLIVGCDKSSTASTDNYTIDDIVGTWDMVSNNMTMTMAIDFSTAFTYLYDEQACTIMGGTYENQDGCTLSDDMESTIALNTCQHVEGQLSNNICTFSQLEEFCCQESSQTLTITSDGNTTMVTIGTEGEETSTGTISIDGTDIIWIMNDSLELMGTLFLSGDNTLTFTFTVANWSGLSLDESFIDAVTAGAIIDAATAGAISITATVSMVMGKSNS